MSTCHSGKRRRTYNKSMTSDRKYLLERVGEAAVAQLYADGFEGLPLGQKILIWHLYRAALAGRDIYASGPPVMLRALNEVLGQQGVEKGRLHVDSFGL